MVLALGGRGRALLMPLCGSLGQLGALSGTPPALADQRTCTH